LREIWCPPLFADIAAPPARGNATGSRYSGLTAGTIALKLWGRPSLSQPVPVKI